MRSQENGRKAMCAGGSTASSARTTISPRTGVRNRMSPAPAAAREICKEVGLAATVTRALRRGEEGHRITRDEALLLMKHAPADELLEAASGLRDRVKGK